MPPPTAETQPTPNEAPKPNGEPTAPEAQPTGAKTPLTPEQEQKLQEAFERAKQEKSSAPLVDYFKTLGDELKQKAEARLRELENKYRKEHPAKTQS